MSASAATHGEFIVRHAEPVMGAVVSFDLRPRGLAYAQTRAALNAACEILHHTDAVFSLYKPDSPLSRLRRGELTVAECPAEVAEVLSECASARELSGGWFDPWALGGAVDPTGLVKGWAARHAAALLRDAGIAAGLVNAAGDVALFGRPSPERRWHTGIRSPTSPDRLLGTVAAEGAVATSGSYERGEHIRDPHTGDAARAALSATVCGPDLALADAFATGLIAAGPAGLTTVAAAGYEALIVTPGGTVESTPAFPFA